MFRQIFLVSSCFLGLNYAADFEKTAICGGLLEPPVLDVDKRIESKTAKKGSTVVLECGFFAVPQASIKWFHRGKAIQSHKAANLESFLTTNQLGQSVILSKYRIDCLDESTSGEYFCQATSPCSGTVVTSALVTIDRSLESEPSQSCKTRRNGSSSIPSAPIITLFTMSRIELPGGVVQLSCRTEGYPQPEVIWSRIEEDESLTPVDLSLPEVMQLQNGDLVLVDDETSFGDSFQCTARNELGAVYEQTHVLFMNQN